MAQILAHEWYTPKLEALLAEADAAGIARDVSVAAITDLVNGKLSAPTPPPSEANPDQDIGEPDSAVHRGPEAGMLSGGEGVPNPLDHLGHNRFGR